MGSGGGGPKTNQYPVWPPFASCSATHLLHIELIRLLWPVGCWSTPLQWLCEVAGYWLELEHAVVYADPEHPKHTQCVTCPVSMLAMQEPRCFQLTGIVYRSLQHGAVHYHAATWGHGREWRRKNWPQDLVTVSLCIQNAINKIHLCSLSITYTCPYHNPTATMGHSIHNVDISKPLIHTTPYTLSAICPVQWKPGFICEENTSPKCQTPSNVSICPLKSVTMMNCSEVQDPDEDNEHADELPWDGFWQFMQKFFGYANRLLQQLSGWLVSDDLGGEDAGCGGPGLVWLPVVCGCEAGWMYWQILWNAFGDGL